MPTPVSLPADLSDFVRHRVAAAVGSSQRLAQLDALHIGVDHAVIRVTLAGDSRQVIVKVAGPTAADADFERTATVMALARAAGTPVAEVLAADTSCRTGRWRFLALEHLAGLEWRLVRPTLTRPEVDEAYRQLATAVLAIQSVRFASFGELDRSGRPVGADLLTSLVRRAELRIRRQDDRELFLGVLDRHRDLFTEGTAATLCHDDLHHANVIFRPTSTGWQLAGILDWDKAWAGPPESDVARMAFWDAMTGPAFWAVYRSASPGTDGSAARALVYQLLWCLEYDTDTPRHRSDTAEVCRRLGVSPVSDRHRLHRGGPAGHRRTGS